MGPEPGAPPLSRYPWRVMFVLWGFCALGVVTVLPYVLTIQGPMLQKALADKPLPLPLPVLLFVQTVQGFVLIGGLGALGLWLARRIGLGAPILEGWLARGEPLWPRLKAVAPRPAIAGAVAGALIVLVDWFFFSERTKEALAHAGINPADIVPSWWKGLLASFYGGADEEVLCRLFLLTLFAWIGAKLARTRPGRPSTAVLWVANVLATVLFGAGHLPTARAMGLTIDLVTVTQVLLLNGIGGIVFGWFYVTLGIEAAIISHFSADIVLHVIAPLFGDS